MPGAKKMKGTKNGAKTQGKTAVAVELESESETESNNDYDNDEDDDSGSDYDDFNREYFTSMYEHEKMLADKERMAFYYHMIENNVHKGMRVLDLGTGTGVLAAFAARRGATVVAVDHSPLMIERAKQLIEANSIEGIAFRSCHSTELTAKSSSKKFDVILHEQMGDILFDELMVPNVCDARNRLLAEGGLILPNNFELFCQPVQINNERHVPFISEHKSLHGIDFSCMAEHQPTRDQEPGYYHFRSSDSSLVDQYLTEPQPIMQITLETLDDHEGLRKKVKFSRTVTSAGRLDGLAVYFKVYAPPAIATGAITSSLCTGPLEESRAVHWGYRVLRIPPPAAAATDSHQLVVGDVITTVLSVGMWENLDTWRWKCTVAGQGQSEQVGDGRRKKATSADVVAAASSSSSSMVEEDSKLKKKKKQKGLPHHSTQQSSKADGAVAATAEDVAAVEFISLDDLLKLQSNMNSNSCGGGSSSSSKKKSSTGATLLKKRKYGGTGSR